MFDPIRTPTAPPVTAALAVGATALVALAAAPGAAAQDVDEQAMMQAYMEAARPGSAHAMLAESAGEWELTVKMWMEPGAEPQVSSATATGRMVLGGRYLVETVEGEIPGMGAFEGRGITGYDNTTGKYRNVWMDNWSTGFMIGEGTFDEDTGILTIHATYTDPYTKKETKVREVLHIVSDDERIYRHFEPGPDGEELKTMEIVYKRKKG